MQEERKCKNCRFYLQHYVKSMYGNFRSLWTGHCVNDIMTVAERKRRVAQNDVCERWESMELQIAARKEDIFNTLARMSAKLQDIAEALRTDNELE